MSMYSSGLDQMADQMAKSGKPAAALEPVVATAAGPEALAAVSAAKMRCGGCGGKVTVGRAMLISCLVRHFLGMINKHKHNNNHTIITRMMFSTAHASQRQLHLVLSEHL